MSTLDDVYRQAEALDLELDHAELDGEWHRVRVLSKKRANLSGAYCLSEMRLRNGNSVIVGMLYNWVTGNEARFTLEGVDGVTPDELAEAKRRSAEAAEKSKQEKKKQQIETAARAQDLWGKLPDTGKSDYLARKKVKAWGLKFTRGSVVVPVRDIEGRLWSLQFIDGEGNKKFLTHGAKRGRFHIISEPIGSPSMFSISEGYATGATVYELLKQPVAVAFDAGNLLPVAQAIRRRWPEIPIYILSDNDLYNGYPQAFIKKSSVTPAVRSLVSRVTQIRPDVQVEFVEDDDPRLYEKNKSHNVGVSAAFVAAAAVGGDVLIPRIITTGANNEQRPD